MTDLVENLPSFPLFQETFGETEMVEELARAYLHVNCSICHRPGGPGISPADFRAFIPFEEMNICNISPTIGNLGIENAKLYSPGNPENLLFSIE